MLPEITIFNIQVSTYSLCAFVGVAAIIFFNSFRMEKYKISFKDIIIYYIFCFVFIFVFSKILYIIGRIPDKGLSLQMIKFYIIHGGIVFYGGMIGAIFGIIIGALVLKQNPREKLDYAAPCFPLFHALARVGCALSGCCYGIESTFGIHNHKVPGATLWPFQPVESICNLIIFISLMIYTKVRGSNKYCLEIYLVAYGICRFILEFFRGDEIRGVWPSGLSTSQYVAILTIIGVIVEIIILLCKKGGKIDDKDS